MTIAMPSRLHFKLYIFFAKLNFNFFYSCCGKRIKEICIINATYWSKGWENYSSYHEVTKHEAKRKKIPWHSFQFPRYIQIFLVPFNADQMKFLPFEYWYKAPISPSCKKKNCLITFDIRHQFFICSIRYTILLHNILYYVSIYDSSAVCNDIRYFFHSVIVDLQ